MPMTVLTGDRARSVRGRARENELLAAARLAGERIARQGPRIWSRLSREERAARVRVQLARAVREKTYGARVPLEITAVAHSHDAAVAFTLASEGATPVRGVAGFTLKPESEAEDDGSI